MIRLLQVHCLFNFSEKYTKADRNKQEKLWNTAKKDLSKKDEKGKKKNLNKIMEWNDSDTYASCERIRCCVELIRKASRRRLNNRTWWRAVKRNQTKQKKAKTHALNHAYCLGALRTHQMEKICIYKYKEQKIDKQQQQQCERDGNMCVVPARARDDRVYRAEQRAQDTVVSIRKQCSSIIILQI